MIQYLSFSDLISLHIFPLGLSLLLQRARSIFFYVWVTPQCVVYSCAHTHFFIRSSSDECLGCFSDLVCVNNAAVNRGARSFLHCSTSGGSSEENNCWVFLFSCYVVFVLKSFCLIKVLLSQLLCFFFHCHLHEISFPFIYFQSLCLFQSGVSYRQYM